MVTFSIVKVPLWARDVALTHAPSSDSLYWKVKALVVSAKLPETCYFTVTVVMSGTNFA